MRSAAPSSSAAAPTPPWSRGAARCGRAAPRWRAWIAEGASVELIDAASITPFDTDTVIDSVRRTGRLVVVHEAPYTGGFGAEIAARVAERALDCLLAPIERVTGFDTVMPLPKLERDYLPGVERIAAALRRTLAHD